MELADALRLQPGDVVTFTGAGGKTAALERLAGELAARGHRVVLTTTTRFGREQVRGPQVIATGAGDLEAAVAEALSTSPVVAVTGVLADGGTKWGGLAPDQAAALREVPGVDFVLIEGDGARGLPLKAPGEHEPVVPSATSVLVAVAGASAFGRPIAAGAVHRPERIAALARLALSGAAGDQDDGCLVTPELVGRLLAYPDGGLKGRPAGARAVALINQCDPAAPGGAERLAAAREAAAVALAAPGLEAVLLGAVGLPGAAVAERHVRVAAIVLAAGASTRLGRFKQLLPWGPAGTPLVAHVVARLRAARGLSAIGVVVGHRGDEVAAALAPGAADVVTNPRWPEGQSSSVRAGLRALPAGTGAALFALCDQPEVGPELVEALIQRHRETGARVAAPRTAGARRGTPTLWDRETFADLLELAGDVGGRGLIEAAAARGQVAWLEWGDEILRDIDRPGDLPGGPAPA
jgi:molybdenum cofactor cytidylyltransferase